MKMGPVLLHRAYRAVGIGAILLGLFACSEQPNLQREEAQKAIKEAREAGAQNYAQATFNQAEKTFQQAQQEEKEQESQWAIMREYDRAKQLYQQAKTEATQAKNEATVQSGQAKNETTVHNEQAKADLLTAMKEARTELEKSQALLSTAPEGKDSDASLEDLKRDLQSAETILSEARQTIDQGNYPKAKEQIQEIKDTTNHVNQQIKQANRKLQR